MTSPSLPARKDPLRQARFRRPLLAGPSAADRSRPSERSASGSPTSLRLLLVDEFQDTDPLQVELIKSLCGDVRTKANCSSSATSSNRSTASAAPSRTSFSTSAGRFPTGPVAAHAQLPQPAGRAPFRQRPVLRCVRPSTSRSSRIARRSTPDAGRRVSVDAHARQDRPSQRRHRASPRARSPLDRPPASPIDRQPTKPIIADRDSGRASGRVEPGDVAILFRARATCDSTKKRFATTELDYYLVGGHAFYAQQEIFDVLNLLRAVASPADEISLAGVLRSPFFALADESLFWLVERRGSLNAGLFAEKLPPELSRRRTAKVERRRRERSPICADQRLACRSRTLLERSPRPHRLRRRAADRVPRRAQAGQLAEAHRAGPHRRPRRQLDLDDFITQLTEFIAGEPKEALAATLPESADVIRLMTIHQAKGLEFPFVVVPDLDRQPTPGWRRRRARRRARPARAVARRRRPRRRHTGMTCSPRRAARPKPRNANGCCTSPARGRPTTCSSPAAFESTRRPRTAIG